MQKANRKAATSKALLSSAGPGKMSTADGVEPSQANNEASVAMIERYNSETGEQEMNKYDENVEEDQNSM